MHVYMHTPHTFRNAHKMTGNKVSVLKRLLVLVILSVGLTS